MSQPLKNQRHEKFAQLVAKGETGAAAYKAVYGGSQKNAEAHACRLVENGGVKDRIAALKQAAARKVEWSIAERLEFLREAALTPPKDLTLSSRVCQGERVTKFGDYLLVPDKIKALVEYGRLAGDYKEKVEITGDGLLALLEAVRGGNKE
mgnify:CR=1 FL=1